MGRDPSSGVHRAPRTGASAKAGVGFFRVVALAVGAVAACAWALVHYYTRVRPPMFVPVETTAATWDAGAGSLPAPELEVETH